MTTTARSYVSFMLVFACGDESAPSDAGPGDASILDAGVADATTGSAPGARADAADSSDARVDGWLHDADATGFDARLIDARLVDARLPDSAPDDGASDASNPECSLTTDFAGIGDGEPWPSPWTIAGGVAQADVIGERGRLVPVTNTYSLARVFAPLDCPNGEATLRFEFTSGSTQGVGYYLRQNGGHLRVTNPTGAGYAGFAEAFRNPAGIGVWRENDGIEQRLGATMPHELLANVVYRMRIRVQQESPTQTRVQARFWPDGEPEPSNWQADQLDGLPALQGVSGGVAIDAWSSLQSGEAHDLFVDDIEVRGWH